MSATTNASSVALGDPVPTPLAAYYDALDAGRFHEAAGAFATDGCYAVPVVGPETQPRIVTTGRAALLERFNTRGPQAYRHMVQLCVGDSDRCLVEGITVTADGEPKSTFVASAAFEDGTIGRYLAFACNGARDQIPDDVPTATTPAPVDDVLHRYFDNLDTGDFDTAAACFSDDVLYSHPPYKHTGIDSDDRVEFRGRRALAAAFVARGRQAFGHDIITCIQRGPHAILEGSVNDLPGGGSGSFISSLSLDADGLIRRYVSFYCEPSVAQR